MLSEEDDPDPFDKFVDYVTARLTEDPHLWAATLLDELRPLGFQGSYQTLTRQVQDRGLRPACTACAHVTKRPNAIIEHPPGDVVVVSRRTDYPSLSHETQAS